MVHSGPCMTCVEFPVTHEQAVRYCILTLGDSAWHFTRGFSWTLPFAFLCPNGETLPRARSMSGSSFSEGAATVLDKG